ncbi:PKD domain-containing protein [Flagellimonas myxillae]|uniref:PKD domain-containing protein n=1 Tax=Flagellimonas myxillae TaxID=2942214 RepID=UPI00201F112D|nr:gliding motility-associated C-terminal domain-containing protein [Muricauda myxillae]MCL6267061.1 gliding motility-associated C-terminal domain-containing protein [Muricauda myxillae]
MYRPLTRQKKEAFFLFFLLFAAIQWGNAQNCSVNAGIPETICENIATYTLFGSTSGLVQSGPTWSQVGGPSVIIVDPLNINTQVNGLVGGNTYTFRLSAVCTDGTPQFQDVDITVQPITVSDAGNDIASCPDNTGAVSTNANTPLNGGETGAWSIVGANNAGVTINTPNSPTTTLTLAESSAGTTTLEWTITGPEYAPGLSCESSSTITVTNYGGVSVVDAGPDQNLDNCYTLTQSTNLAGSFGGNNINGQVGTWSFVSGPNTPVIANANTNNTNVSNLIEGTYTFRWSVSGPCASGEDTMSITVAEATQDITTASLQDDNIRFCDASITTVTLIGSVPLFTDETVTWTQTSGPVAGVNILSPNSSTTQITGLDGSSTYQFTYTIENGTTLCSDSATATVQYSTAPVSITANGGSDIVAACGITSVDIPFVTTGNGTNTYSIVSGPSGSTLVDPGTFSNTGGTPLNINFDVEGTYTVLLRRSLNGSIQTGCDVATDAINVTVAMTPTAANAGTDQTLACNVVDTDITGNIVTVGSSLWSQISGPNQATIASPYARTTNVANLIPGTYVFQYAISGGNACAPSQEDTVEIIVSSDAPVATDAGLDQTICFGAPTILAANAVPSSNLEGVWTVDTAPVGATIVFADANDPNTLVSGLDDPNEIYIFRWTISNPDDPACPNPGTDTVTISTNATQGPTLADAGADQCVGTGVTTVTLVGNQPAGDEIGTWSAVPAVGIAFDDPNQFDTDATITVEQSYILTWTISKIAPGCQDTSDEVEITIGPDAIADAGPDQTECQSTFTMDASGSVGSGGFWTQISGPGGFSFDDDTSPTAQVTFTYSGQYVFEWTANNGSCSSDTDQVTLNVGIPPTTAVVTSPSETICSATTVILDGNAFNSDIENGYWTLLSGAPNTPTFSDINDPNATVTGMVSGSYTFRWTIAGDSNCPTSFADKTVDVYVPANAGPDMELCNVQNFLLEATFGSTGTWVQTFGPGVGGAPGTPATITQNPVGSNVAEVSDIVLGSFYIFEFTTNYPGATGCGNTSDQVQVESSGLPSVLPDAGPDQLLCIGDLVVPNQTTLAGNMPPDDVDEATWSFTEQPAGSTAVITNVNDPTSTITGLTVPGTYILEWNFEAGFCFNTSDVVRIEVYEAPSAADAGPDQLNACQLEAQLNAVPPTVGTGTWTLTTDPSGGAAVIDNPNSPTSTLSNITVNGTYILTWTVAHNSVSFVDSPSACDPTTDTVSITFPDDAPSLADAGPDQELCAATQTNMAATALVIGTGTWTQTAGPGVGGTPGTPANIVTPNSETTLIDTLESGTYEFTWTVLNGGCTFEDTLEVVIYEDPVSTDAGPDQNLDQFSSVIMAADAPIAGTGTWTQVSGPTTVGFVNENDPNTEVFGATSGTYVFEWTVTNGICAPVSDTVEVALLGIDLELSKSVSPTIANPGDTVTFTLDVFNNDASSATDAIGVTVRDVIPSGYTLVPGTVSNGGVYNIGDFSITWSNLSINNGATLNLTFDATVNVSGNYENTAEITGNGIFDIDSTVDNGVQGEDDQDSAQVTIVESDLSLTKDISAASSATPNVGDTVVYEITITNDGPDTATNIAVQDVVPSGLTIGTINNGGVNSSGTISWTIANLPVGSTTLSYESTVNTPTGTTGEYTNVTEITASDQWDADSTPNNDDGDQSEDDEDNFTLSVSEEADLSIAKSVIVGSLTPNVGETLTFELIVSNAGPNDATGVSVEDVLPAGFTLSAVNGGGSQAGNTASWSGLFIPNGGNIALSYQASVNTPTGAPGEYTNAAQITGSGQVDTDSDPTSGFGVDDLGDTLADDDETSLTLVPQEANLSVDKSVSDATPNVGEVVTFTVQVDNAGPDVATNVSITDAVPDGYTIVGGSVSNGGIFNLGGSEVLWNLANVPLAGVTLSYEATVNAPTGAVGEYQNIVEITASDQYDSNSTPNNDDGDQSEDDEDSETIIPEASDLSLVKDISAASSATPNVGDTVVFELTVTNAGPSAATNVVVEDIVPIGYTLQTVNNGGTDIAGTFLTWNIANIPVGSTTVSYEVTVNAPTGATDEYLNTAEIAAADQFDQDSNPGNDDGDQDEDDEDFYITSPQVIDLELELVASNPTPDVGEVVTFTVNVSNFGPDAASGISIENLVPPGYATITGISNGGTFSFITDIITWTGLNVPVGANALSLTFNATVQNPTGALGEFMHIAEVTFADQFDTDSTPNNDDGDQSEDDETAVTVAPLQSDLSLTKIVVDNDITPNVGDEISFEITVSNSGPNDATNVVVQDLLPTGFNYVLYSATAGTYDDVTGLWQVGTVANGSNETLIIDVLVNTTGDYTNIAQITASDGFDIDSTPSNGVGAEDDQDEVVVVPVAVADLSLTKNVDNANPDVNTNVVFTLTVSNSGPSDANNIVVTDLLPSGYTYVSDDSGGTYVDGTGIWTVGALANGGSSTLNITATVNPTGDFTNVAEITAADQPDIDSTPNNGLLAEDDQDAAGISPNPLVDISVTKTADDLTPNVGDQIVFTVSVLNDGPNDATNVVVTDFLASGYEFVSAAPSTGVYEPLNGSWTIGNLANGGSETIVITANVLANGDYTNIAELTDLAETDVDSVPANNDDTEDDQQTVEPVPVLVSDLILRKSVDILSPLVGEEVIFNISITNNGPSDVTGVEVLDLLPSGYTYVSNNRTAGVYTPTTGIWELNGIIPNGTTETLNIVATVNATGDYFNVTEVFSSNNLDPNSTPNNNNVFENDQDSAGTTPIPSSDLSLSKTVDNANPDVGANVTFTVTLTNDGLSDATGVVVSDALPSGYTYVSDDSGGTYSSASGLWNVGTIAGGSSIALNIVAQVNPTGDYTNVAEVIAVIQLDQDSTPGNNDSSEDDQAEQSTTPRTVTDISVTKTVDNLSPSVGDEIVFTVTVNNSGPNDASGIVVEDLLASGYTLVSVLPSTGVYYGLTGSWDIGSLANGASATMQITAQVLASGDYRNTAELIALDTFDPDSTPNNNLGSEDDQDTVVPVPDGLADLELTKTVDNPIPNVGDVVEFTLNLTNNGFSDATGVEVTDLLPVGYTYQSHITTAGIYNSDTGLWTLNGPVFNLSTESLIILATVNTPTGVMDEYVNVAEITASDFTDPDSNPNQGINTDDLADGNADDDEAVASVTPQTTDITISKTVDNTSPSIGAQVVFTITVGNQGSVAATNIGIEEILPSGYRLITAQASEGIYDEIAGFWELDQLAALGTANLQLTVEVLDIDDYLNTASLAYVDQLDTNNSNDVDQAEVAPTCLTVYNEFSPNGDGVNEYFKIDCINRYPNNVLQVYNRWGTIVYEKRSYNNEWDGTSTGRATVQQGDLLPVGTYYYVLDLGDGSEPRTDWLYINR